MCLKKHQASKNQQASWNADQSRHDRGTFSTKVGSQSVAQAIARKALGLGPDVVLEDLEADCKTGLQTKLLMESARPSLDTDEVLGAVMLIAKRA